MKKRLIIMLASLALLFCCSCSRAPTYEYVLYVNGHGIIAEEYISYCWRFLGEADPEGSLDAASFKDALDADGTTLNGVIKDSALEYILISRFFAEKAEELGISLDQEEINGLEGEIATLEASHGGKEAYEKYLADSGMSASVNREIYLSDLLKNKVTRAMFEEGGPYAPSQKDLRDYFSWNYITATHILRLCANLETGEPYSEKAQGEALRISNEAIARYSSGEDFFDLVRELGEDSGLKKHPSLTYTFTYGAMTSDFEKAAFALEENEITETPLRTAYGYHVILRLPLDNAYFDENTELIASDYARAECAAMLDIWKGSVKTEYSPAFDEIDMSAYFD